MFSLRHAVVTLAALVAPVGLAAPAGAQQQAGAAAGALRVAPSGRGMTQISLVRQPAAGAPASAQPVPPAHVAIDYGQPSARGRKIAGTVVPFGAVWRTGANEATAFTTDVDLTIGGIRVPKGSYTLFTLPSAAGWKLIVNKQTGQWGTEYHAEQDLARIPLRSRTLAEPIETLTMWLVPTASAAPSGVLKMAWGDVELSADWQVAAP